AKLGAKLLARGHATYDRYANDSRVYHIFSRKVFRAISRDDLQPRRSRHQVGYIKTRLITLDFVLRNLDCQYLDSETRKVEFFAQTLDIAPSLLPSKVYRSRRGEKGIVRYFVDHFPIFLRGSSEPLLSFTYVDPGAQTLEGFRTHLESYAALLRSTPKFEFLYLAPTPRLFRTAQAQFSRMVRGLKGAPSTESLVR